MLGLLSGSMDVKERKKTHLWCVLATGTRVQVSHSVADGVAVTDAARWWALPWGAVVKDSLYVFAAGTGVPVFHGVDDGTAGADGARRSTDGGAHERAQRCAAGCCQSQHAGGTLC